MLLFALFYVQCVCSSIRSNCSTLSRKLCSTGDSRKSCCFLYLSYSAWAFCNACWFDTWPLVVKCICQSFSDNRLYFSVNPLYTSARDLMHELLQCPDMQIRFCWELPNLLTEIFFAVPGVSRRNGSYCIFFCFAVDYKYIISSNYLVGDKNGVHFILRRVQQRRTEV